jgi:hypothetical protein
MLPAVHLDFIPRPTRHRLWLLAALVLLGVSWSEHQAALDQAAGERLKAQARLAQTQPVRHAADANLASLNWPWQRLFHALEHAPQDNIAVLAIEAEGRSGVVRIQAETPDGSTLQSYLQALAAHGLNTPRLTQQQLHNDDTGPSLTRFNVEATWQP